MSTSMQDSDVVISSSRYTIEHSEEIFSIFDSQTKTISFLSEDEIVDLYYLISAVMIEVSRATLSVVFDTDD